MCVSGNCDYCSDNKEIKKGKMKIIIYTKVFPTILLVCKCVSSILVLVNSHNKQIQTMPAQERAKLASKMESDVDKTSSLSRSERKDAERHEIDVDDDDVADMAAQGFLDFDGDEDEGDEAGGAPDAKR